MEFKLDQLIAHLVIYLVILIALKRLYIDPALSLIKKREALTLGRQQSSHELSVKLQKMKESYSETWEKTKLEIEERRNRVLKEVREEVEHKLQTAKKENERKLLDHQKILENELNQLEPKISQMAAELSKEIVDSVMSAKVVRL